MSNSPSSSQPNDPVEQALAEFIAAWNSGGRCDPDSFCRDHAQCGPELRRRLEELIFVLEHLARDAADALHDTDNSNSEAANANQDPTDSSRELLKRLRARGPTHTRYKLKGEAGRGGMGAILRVWDQDLNRHLAMKVILGKSDEGGGTSATGRTPEIEPSQLARFLEEAQVTGQLDHPGIVPVHELGLDERGRVYFTMRLVKGHNLKEILDLVSEQKEGWNQTRALSVILKVCEAMAYAHDKGVIHRDLKPGNVMVGRFGEVYVMDWGLARVLGREEARDLRIRPEHDATISSVKTTRESDREQSPDSPIITMDGHVLGTPPYMPLEQALGKVRELGKRTDVYAVGAMLYHLLAGQMPYVPKGTLISARTVLGRVIEGPPRPIQKSNPTVPAELVAIAEKAMARKLGDRYPDMVAMADDLRAYLERRVVKAYETGAIAELRKWVVRNRALAASLLGGVVTLAAGFFISWTLYGREQVARAEAQSNAQQAQQNETRARRLEERATREAKVALSLSGIKRLQELKTDANKLWPRRPRMIVEMARWLARAEHEVDLVPKYESYLAEVRTIVGRTSEQDWLLDNLVLLLTNLKEFADPDPQVGLVADVRMRLDVASTIEANTITEQGDAWDEATDAIAKSALYLGLELEPQLGLVPLGEDPDSKLWEFWAWESGERPERDETTNRWKITGKTGIVLVLLPGGTFSMGSQKDSPLAPNYDPESFSNESPVHQVTLKPFFLSQHELTQGQWQHIMGFNPSYSKHAGQPNAGAFPVEQVSYDDCVQMLLRIGLVLPTEAQWEYGARGGTTTPYWTGATKESLKQAANLEDESYRKRFRDPGASESWDDGYSDHAPVGSFRANGFGLCDTAGNVWEWCRDWYGPYTQSVKAEDGERNVPESGDQTRVSRGGSFEFTAAFARSANRYDDTPAYRTDVLGCRPARDLEP